MGDGCRTITWNPLNTKKIKEGLRDEDNIIILGTAYPNNSEKNIPASHTLDYWFHIELFVSHVQLRSVSDLDGIEHGYLK